MRLPVMAKEIGPIARPEIVVVTYKMNPALSVVAHASTEKEDFDLSSFQTTVATG